MPEQALYDLSPLLRLMLMGLLLALAPLAWVWLRQRQAPLAHRLRLLTLVTLFLTFDLVLFGAFTRLTDSGLGCPDWPGCYGSASPFGAHAEITLAQSAQPSGPVTHSKAWIEMIHRYLATAVGVLILTLAITTWLARRQSQLARPAPGAPDHLPLTLQNERESSARRTRSDPRGGHLPISFWWPLATLFWVCIQGAFGALTVTMKLFPAIVTLHLLGGMVLLALLRAQAARYAQAAGALVPEALPRAWRRLLLLTFALVWLQIALGGWVSTNYAVLACSDFPACQNSFWPAMDFRQGFTIWRELGAGPGGENISFAALTAIHYVHRLAAYAVFAALLVLAFKLYERPAMRRHALWIGGLALWQFATGLSNVVLGWPLLAAVSHTGGAAALVIVLTGAIFSSRSAFDVLRVARSRVSTLPA